MEYLTGNIEFTTEVVVFEDYIQKWKNKEIIYLYNGYGGWRESTLNLETFEFEYLTPAMNWEDDKQYKAKVLEVSQDAMVIELDNGYKFRIHADDFRSRKKWEFDICEP